MEDAGIWLVVRCPVEIPSANVDSATLDWQGGKRSQSNQPGDQTVDLAKPRDWLQDAEGALDSDVDFQPRNAPVADTLDGLRLICGFREKHHIMLCRKGMLRRALLNIDPQAKSNLPEVDELLHESALRGVLILLEWAQAAGLADALLGIYLSLPGCGKELRLHIHSVKVGKAPTFQTCLASDVLESKKFFL
ncbi:hypothetical protein AK812_SmicGene33941 [Symbiodinium microadriaticum]|uniref:Uncharacterized protein n=1 Tax=Symbiodinium microadriaticum TaxID=2951 RepID=A0A1Q9CQB7_SYMMI|nr:hypothetical protein AK812_SmicGene33941 [Symbiodinium microadriaticum]